MTPVINLITPPDKLLNENRSVLVVNPSDSTKQQLNTFLKDLDINLNLYVYEEDSIQWLIEVSKFVDRVLIDIDNVTDKWIIGYLLRQQNTFYLTSSTEVQYTIINKNRLYDIAQFLEGVQIVEVQ